MSDIVTVEKTQIDSSNRKVDTLSPKNPQYAIQFFTTTLQNKLVQAESFAESVYKAVIKVSISFGSSAVGVPPPIYIVRSSCIDISPFLASSSASNAMMYLSTRERSVPE